MEASAEDTFTPRNYQLHLLNQAKRENTIAVLNTGSGKTLCAGMLIKWIIDFSTERKICVFLAPTVPLVIQQAEYMRNTFMFKVQEFYGSMGVDAWRNVEWMDRFDKNEVFVMTPMILVGILKSAFIKLSMMHVLIMDECHHARKNDPYAQIVGLWRLCDEKTRPKLFGMTASPSNNKSSVTSSIKVLEANMECKAFTSLIAHTATLQAHAPTPMESILEYPEMDFHDPPHIYSLLHALLNRFKICGLAFERMNAIIDEFGEWYLERHVRLLVRKFIDAEDIYAISGDDGVDAFLPFELATNPAYFPHTLALFKTSILSAQQLLTLPENRTLLAASTISSKLATLATLLQSYSTHPTLCAIIFCQKRTTAILLQLFIEEFEKLAFINSGYLIGHGTSGNPGLGKEGARAMCMRVNDQKEVIEKFRCGKLNLLVSTQVGEEGLDIQPCMLVVRYDPAETLINYIQSRGRARHATSHYINLCEKSHTASRQKIELLKHQEIEMKNSIRLEGFQSNFPGNHDDDDELRFDERGLARPLMKDEVYIVESTGALCTVHTAVAHLHQYCSGLPSDEYSVTGPEFQTNESDGIFQVTITLPMMVPSACRILTGPRSPSKKVAKEIVCLMAVRLLHEHGEFDDRLKPTHSKHAVIDIYEGVVEIEAVQEPSDGRVYPTARPKCFNVGISHGVKRIMRVEATVAGVTHLFGLVVDDSTPSIAFSADYSSGNSCLVKTEFTKLTFTSAQLLLLKTFHHEFLLVYLRNICFDYVEEYGYLICPLLQTVDGIAVDWTQVEQVKASSLQALDSTVLTSINARTPWQTKHTVVRDAVFYDRSYQLIKIINHATPETPLTKEFLDSLNHISEYEFTTTDHFSSVKSHYKIRLNYLEEVSPNQPLLLCTKIPYPNEEMYMVQADTAEAKKKAKFVLLLPQTCRVSGFDAVFLDTGHLIPVVMRLMEHELIVRDYQVQLGLEVVPRSTFRTALTVRNMRYAYDYERPELLGDAFLKFVQTMHLFCNYLEWHEGRLSMVRQKIENNEYLRTKGMHHDLTSYVLSGQFYRKEWTPAMQHGFVVNGIKMGTNQKKLSDKTIADCVEAIIGVCIEHDQNGVSRETIGMQAINHLLSTHYHTDWRAHYLPLIIQTYDAKTLNLQPERKIRIMVDLGVMTGYQFVMPVIALEALTHASYADPSWPCGCFQRLEFLGDAVLYYIITRYLYAKYPELSPGAMTEYRTYLISNEFLACVSAEMGLINLTYIASLPLQKAIMSYTNRIKLARKPGNMYWRDFKGCPKAVADVYESMVGAIFLDSGMDLAVVEAFIMRTAVQPWLSFIGEPDGSKMHPTTRCMKIIQEQIRCTKFKFETACRLMQHGILVLEATSRTKKDAKYQVSREASSVLEERREEFVAVCSCAKKRVAVDILSLD